MSLTKTLELVSRKLIHITIEFKIYECDKGRTRGLEGSGRAEGQSKWRGCSDDGGGKVDGDNGDD